MGCPYKLLLAWGLCSPVQGLLKPLAALCPSDCFLNHLASETMQPGKQNNHLRQGWKICLVPFFLLFLGWRGRGRAGVGAVGYGMQQLDMGSQFPDWGLSPGSSSESAES